MKLIAAIMLSTFPLAALADDQDKLKALESNRSVTEDAIAKNLLSDSCSPQQWSWKSFLPGYWLLAGTHYIATDHNDFFVPHFTVSKGFDGGIAVYHSGLKGAKEEAQQMAMDDCVSGLEP